MSEASEGKRLAELFDFKNGRSFKKSEWSETGLPIIRIQNLNDISKPSNRYEGEYDSAIEVNNGDLLFSWSGTVGSSFGPHIWDRGTGVLNQHIYKLSFKDETNVRYAFYALLHITAEIEQSVRGAVGLVHVTKTDLKEFRIPHPLLAEQKRIVSILDEAFGAIERAKENAQKNLANARELFESYLNRVFTEKGEGWEEKTVGEICKSVEYGTSSKSTSDGDVPVLRMGNIQNREIDWADLKYSSDSEEIEKYSLRDGDVLFNRTNSAEHVGKTCIYRGDRPAIFAGYLIRVHYDKERVNGEYLNYYLNSDEARDYGKTVMSQSVNQANINGKKLKGYSIPLAPLDQQRSIVSRFNVLNSETRKIERVCRLKLTALDELKQSILQKAFTGKLTAKSPELELV